MVSTTAPAVLDALKTALVARPGLAGVTVSTAPFGKESPREAIVFIRINGASEWAALGAGARRERYTLEGVVHVSKSGSDESTAKAARDRAKVLLDELVAEVGAHKPASVTQVTLSELNALTWDQAVNPERRTCLVTIAVNVEARI